MISKRKKILGMTIVEMIVALGIFSLGMAGATLLFVRVWNGNSYTLEMGQSAMAVSQGLNRMIGYIREASQSDNGGYPIESAAANDLVIFSDYDSDDVVERLHFYKSGQSILLGTTKPNNDMPKTYPSGDQQTLNIANSIVNDSNTPIFYYYDNNYSGAANQNPLTAPINFSAVRLIKIFLQININPNRAPDNIQMQSFVKLRNLGEYN